MLRWRWVLLLWLIGGLATAYGVAVELEVRAAVGGGFNRFLANVFARDEIHHYRWISMLCAIGGPCLIVLAYLLRRNWDRLKEGRWFQRRAELQETRAAWWLAESRRLLRRDPAAARAAERKARKFQRKSQRLSERAIKRLREGDAT